jgi:hypothetical protein
MRRHKREDKHSLSESSDAGDKKEHKLGKVGKLLDVGKLSPEEICDNLTVLEDFTRSNGNFPFTHPDPLQRVTWSEQC